MKNQYFGDRNDFFKYDLALTVSLKSGRKRFTFIPMLTPNDGSGDGGIVRYGGERNPLLFAFLRICLKNNRRDIRNLRRFMADRPGIVYCPYQDTAFFTHNTRHRYFALIDNRILHNAVILVDPDNGLEVKTTGPENGHKYLQYSEAQALYAGMDMRSALVIYQHLPRQPRRRVFNRISSDFQEILGRRPLWISDNRIAFLIITKSNLLDQRIWRILNDAYPEYQKWKS